MRRAPRPRKRRQILLHCDLAPGDIVVLTGALRDLHAAYPGEFAIDVRTRAQELWMYNPGLTALEEDDPGVEIVPVEPDERVDSNRSPVHIQHWLLDAINRRLGTRATPRFFHGEIHTSAAERALPNPIQKLAGRSIPYWLIASGGKRDHTIKWWSHSRYQEVVDRLRDRIQFVQVGAPGDPHSPLRGVVDLRGRTSIRELILWMSHAQGVVCGITFLMHLAAAVENAWTGRRGRPTVVIAGGREPVHWFAYPGHQVLHNVDQLPCSGGGCWKSRTHPLGDGTVWDKPDRICTQHVGGLARCMDLITAEDVVRRVEGFFEGGVSRALTAVEALAGREAVRATAGASEASTSSTVGWRPAFLTPVQSLVVPKAQRPTTPVSVAPNRFTLVTICDRAMDAVGRESLPRLRRYARRHGFGLRVFRKSLDPSRPMSWSKVTAVLELLESGTADWVFWVDADAFILNPEVDVRTLLVPGADLVFASDFNGLCAGVFLARACPWTIRFLQAARTLGGVGYDPDGMGDKWEQNTFKHLLAHFPEHQSHVALVPDTAMNSSYSDYRSGHFILHLGAMSHRQRLEMLRGILREDTRELESRTPPLTDGDWMQLRAAYLSGDPGAPA
ncbi:MAG: glycosyltransferase family 9 protein [Verrucomicrobiota bacterium]